MQRALQLLLVALVMVVVCASFQPACDIHTVNPGRRSPNTVLPQKAIKSWLYASQEDIEKWYQDSKAQCPQYMTAAVAELAQTGRGDYFTNISTIPAVPKCRGRNTLLDYTGTVLVPFGPYQECPTYSKCWFGLMSCGKPKDDQMRDALLSTFSREMKQAGIPGKMPGYTKWSVRALHLLIRVVGAEIVVPDVRFLTLSDTEEVLIGQYVLTRPYINTKLEMRLFELYPSVLLDWTPVQIEEYGMHNIMSLHLGGNEGRCSKPCGFANNCCGCDAKSYVTSTPTLVRVEDGSTKCPGIRDKPLPLCPARDSTQPGRWIASSMTQFQPHCSMATDKQVHFHMRGRMSPKGALAAESAQEERNRRSNARGNNTWFEASGDPCLVNFVPVEDDRAHWFYAPYTCKYHFFSSTERHQCLADQQLTHIHVTGDSMARDFFDYLSEYLGVPKIEEMDLKHLTNTMKKNNLKFHSGKVMLSLGFSWDYDPRVLKLVEEAPLPNVYITNFALSHRNWNVPQFRQLWGNTEYPYWSKERPKSPIPSPKYMFFQTAKEMTGRRFPQWAGNVMRQESSFLQQNFTSLGFSVLDEFLFSSGRYEFHIPRADGWHFGGTKRQMEVVALFNMICSDWQKAQTKKLKL